MLLVISFLYPNENMISPFITSIWRSFMMLLINIILIKAKGLRINILDDS